MVSRIENLATYFKERGWDQIGKDLNDIAEKARASGMEAILTKKFRTQHSISEKPKGKTLTPELAAKFNTSFGGEASDDIKLRDLYHWSYFKSEHKLSEFPYKGWNDVMLSTDTGEKKSITNLLGFIVRRKNTLTVGWVREISTEDLETINGIGKNTSEFLKAVFRKKGD